jgi:hypothetical protein
LGALDPDTMQTVPFSVPRRAVLGVFGALSALALLAVAGCRSTAATERKAREGLAVHVARSSWSEPHELLALIDGAAEVGFGTIVFEDRCAGTAAHPSPYEPWSEHLGGVDPGWDPLALALGRARERGLRFLVAMQLVPVWSGAVPPRDPEHPWHKLRAWRWVDAEGKEQALRPGALLSLDPCLPEVRLYVATVVLEVLRRYDVDGLVLVDARYPNDYPSVPRGAHGDPPQGERTRALYRDATGLAPADDDAAWRRWRATQLTELVRLLRAGANAIPGRARAPELIAEVLPDLEAARAQQQDWRAWLDQGLVDAVAPIDDGRRDPNLLRVRTEHWRERTLGGARFMPALRVDVSPTAVADDGENARAPLLDRVWSTRLAALRAATGMVLVTGAEPWLRTGLPDFTTGPPPGEGAVGQDNAPSTSAREVLAAALARS